MKAAVFHAHHDVRVEDVPEPSAPGPGEVTLRPFFCGICGTDLHEYAMGPIVIPAEPHRLNGSVLPQIGQNFPSAMPWSCALPKAVGTLNAIAAMMAVAAIMLVCFIFPHLFI